MAARFTVVDVDELEPAGPTGAVRFLRRALGATAFGFNWFELPPGAAGPEHDETDSKQEEVMIVLSGTGSLTIDGEELVLAPRRVVRLDPEAVRQVRAGDDGITFVSIGAPREEPYVARGPF
ncbi:MAG TPA: cupin domain-containing protein [Gaiella sp.]|jgi:quercetin dioxygenase-like cupin family protein|nr:cupin domain-containing protein [Gaiella sp.]